MSGTPLVPQPPGKTQGSDLRAVFKQYLQAASQPERLAWQSFTTRDGLPHNWIYNLFQDSLGRIWAGTWGGGAACYQDGQWRAFTTADGLHSNEVTCIREDSQGRIWMATDNGLNVMDAQSGRIADAGLAGKSLLNITFDRRGALWAGCWRAAHSGGGLFRFDGHAWQAFTTRQELPGLEILIVFNDAQDRIWVGTYEHGLGAGVGCYDGQRWHNYNTAHGLANNCVYSMFEDPSGNMWFGTTGGVSLFDGRQWHTLTRSDGLADNRIYSMLIDSHKKMWFGTEEGISRFDGQNWVSYTQKDGLVNNLVRAILEAQDGSLWFGTYPYARGAGGISVGRYPPAKTLTDCVLDLLPEPPPAPALPPGG